MKQMRFHGGSRRMKCQDKHRKIICMTQMVLLPTHIFTIITPKFLPRVIFPSSVIFAQQLFLGKLAKLSIPAQGLL